MDWYLKTHKCRVCDKRYIVKEVDRDGNTEWLGVSTADALPPTGMLHDCESNLYCLDE